MKTVTVVMMLMLGMLAKVAAYEVEGNPDRKISIGLNYDRTHLNSEYGFRTTKISDFTKVNGNSFLADVKLPLSSLFTFQLRGGYTTQSNDIFTGETVDYSGYDIGFGVRLYLP